MTRLLLAAVLAGSTTAGCARRTEPAPGAAVVGVVAAPVPGPERVLVYLEPVTPRLESAGPPRSATLTLGTDGRFTAELAGIDEGGGVSVVNADRRTWNISCPTPGNELDVGALAPGGQVTVAVRKRGAVDVVARSGAEERRAVVFAAPSTHFEVVTTGSDFRLENVPPGRYTLVGWARGYFHRRAEEPLMLEPAQEVRQNVVMKKVGP